MNEKKIILESKKGFENEKTFKILTVIIISVGIVFAGIWAFNFFFLPRYKLEEAFPNLEFEYPVGIYNAGDGSNRLFVVDQRGIIYVFKNEKDTTTKSVFLDIRDKVIFGGEMGLLGLAFHPNFQDNRLFYIDYVTPNPRRSIISRFELEEGNPNKANKSSEKVLFMLEQPYENHNGGQIVFGPDDYLYIALGDGGDAGDPLDNAQNRRNLFGTILRIDVDNGNPYSIPSDNPYKDNTNDYREEIYAYGLRNPWRFSFDPVTELLWCADVGQGAWEEINIIKKGKNYGWNIKEGDHCYDAETCDEEGLTDPIYEYSHEVGHSITGGFVYRGKITPSLRGKYIYGDYEYGQIWALEKEGLFGTHNKILIESDLEITSFGIDEDHELYICAFDGKIYQIREEIIVQIY